MKQNFDLLKKNMSGNNLLKGCWGSLRTRTVDWVSPFKVALLAIMLFSLMIYNYANFRQASWSLHPDSFEAYVIGQHLKETGSLTFRVPVNEDLGAEFCTPAGAGSINGKVVPQRAFGIYLLCALGLFLGKNGPYYLIPLCGLVCVIFFFKSAEIIMGEKKALLATFLFALSAPMVFWSNMLFANVPGLACIVIGLYFLLKIVYKEDDRLRSYILSAVFLSAGVWLRYEFLAILVFLLPLVLIRRKDFRLRHVIIGFITVIICLSPILLINKSVYGDAFSTGYTPRVASQPDEAGPAQEVPEEGMFSKLKQGTERIFNRFFTQIIHPELGLTYNVFRDSVQSVFPVLTLAALFGWILLISNGGRDRAVAVTFFLVVLFWIINSCTAGMWDAGIQTSIIGTSYIRYNLVVFMIFALLSTLFMTLGRNIYGRGGYRTVLVFFLVSFLFTQLVVLMIGPFALKYSVEQEAFFKEISQAADQLPDNAVMVSSIYAKAIVGRPVLNTYNFLYEEEPDEAAAVYIEKLLDKGYQVFIIEPSWHKQSYFNLNGYMALQKRFSVNEIMKFNWNTGGRIISDTMYQVSLVPEGQ